LGNARRLAARRRGERIGLLAARTLTAERSIGNDIVSFRGATTFAEAGRSRADGIERQVAPGRHRRPEQQRVSPAGALESFDGDSKKHSPARSEAAASGPSHFIRPAFPVRLQQLSEGKSAWEKNRRSTQPVTWNHQPLQVQNLARTATASLPTAGSAQSKIG